MTTDPVPPRVFISWSGESEPIASQLRDLLKLIFGSRLGFWMSRDTNPGERWGDALDRQLENTNFGILCLVPNNLTAPWINYEAGALSKTKTLNSSVVPYCAGFDEGELDQPLSRFQAATAGRDGTFNLVRNMNELLTNKLSVIDLETRFNKYWDQYNQTLKELLDCLGEVRRTPFDCLTVTELLRRESPDGKGRGELSYPTHIYVNSSQPVESKHQSYAKRVMYNLREGAKYSYVFKLHQDNSQPIADMIVRLALVPQTSESERVFESEVENELENELKSENQAFQGPADAGSGMLRDTIMDEVAVDKNIGKLKDAFEIMMVEESYGIEYCILNAKDDEDAHCYLRLPTSLPSERKRRWIDWTRGDSACRMAKQVEALRLDDGKSRIIRPSKGCDFYNEYTLRDQLREEARKLKSKLAEHIRGAVEQQLADKLINICIG